MQIFKICSVTSLVPSCIKIRLNSREKIKFKKKLTTQMLAKQFIIIIIIIIY